MNEPQSSAAETRDQPWIPFRNTDRRLEYPMTCGEFASRSIDLANGPVRSRLRTLPGARRSGITASRSPVHYEGHESHEGQTGPDLVSQNKPKSMYCKGLWRITDCWDSFSNLSVMRRLCRMR